MAGKPLDDRQQRGRVLYELGLMFPSGDSDDRRSRYLERIDARGVCTDDLIEAGRRIEGSRTQTTYPPLADLLERCADVRRERVANEATSLRRDDEDRVPFTADDLTEFRRLRSTIEAGVADDSAAQTRCVAVVDAPAGWHSRSRYVFVGGGTPWAAPADWFFKWPQSERGARYREWVLSQPMLVDQLDSLRGRILVQFAGQSSSNFVRHGDVLADLVNDRAVDPPF
tara:strand:- start:804 stop:1484 length:681 start_codon:yes stop_codon:yes gene_type:complete